MEKYGKEQLTQRQEEPITLTQFLRHCEQFFPNRSICNYIQTQAQMNHMISFEDRRYSKETKRFALILHCYGPEVYQFMRKIWSLPTIKTLKGVTANWEIGVGFNDVVFNVLSIKSKTMTHTAKECILCADEMSLKSFLYYNYSKDEIVGFREDNSHKTFEIANNVLVLMIRGVHDSWRQPLAYFFVSTTCTGNSLQDLIFNCIKKLGLISFNVKAMISDLGPTFKLFVDTIGITPEKPYFKVGKSEISYIFDPPNLLKATRNNFLLYRFQSDSKISEFKYLKHFYDIDESRSHKLAPKLTEIHMKPNSFQNLKVKLAAEIFSETVVDGMTLHMSEKLLSSEAIDTIEFIYSMNNLFDLFNFKPKTVETEFIVGSESHLNKPEGAKRFYVEYQNLDFQNELLNNMFDYFKNLKIKSCNLNGEWIDVTKSYNIKFINGWMISIAGLKHLYRNLSSEPSKKIKLSTRRLNNDCLENIFGTIRAQNNNCINPTYIQFKRTFKKLFCNNYFEYSGGANFSNDLDALLTGLRGLQSDDLNIIFPEKEHLVRTCPLPIDGTHYRSLQLSKSNAFDSVCGYLMNMCIKMHTCEVCMNYARATKISDHDNFIFHFDQFEQEKNYAAFTPTISRDSIFYRFIFDLDQIFINNFDTFALTPNVGKTMKQCMNNIYFEHPCPQFPKDYLLSLFIRLRIYSTLTKTNRNLSLPSRNKKRNRKIILLSKL